MYLWVVRNGQVFDNADRFVELVDLLTPHHPSKLRKGGIPESRELIDLANVEGRMSIISGVEEVDELGSDKIEFGDCDLAISKLEPYLGKVLVNDPEKNWIGTPEWLTYTISSRVEDIDYLRFLLLTPEMLEAYRCLQSGKRHARMTEADFLALRVPEHSGEVQKSIADICKSKMEQLKNKRQEIEMLREEIDSVVYGPS